MPENEMVENANWWQSRGVVGGIVSLVSVGLGLAGYTLTEADKEVLVVTAMGLGGMVGSLVAIIGRLKATRKIK